MPLSSLSCAGDDPGVESNSLGSTPKAQASFLTVPKWGREILPLSIPDTVVGLTPASSANRPWVHIRSSRRTATLTRTSLLSMSSFLSSTCVLYHNMYENCTIIKKLPLNCLKTVMKRIQYRCR